MSWNYRVVQTEDGFGIHEVHYADDGTIENLTVEPMPVTCNPDEDLKETFEQMASAFKLPVLKAADFPKDDEEDL